VVGPFLRKLGWTNDTVKIDGKDTRFWWRESQRALWKHEKEGRPAEDDGWTQVERHYLKWTGGAGWHLGAAHAHRISPSRHRRRGAGGRQGATPDRVLTAAKAKHHLLAQCAVSLPFRDARRHELDRTATRGLAVPGVMEQQKAPIGTADFRWCSVLVFRFYPYNLLGFSINETPQHHIMGFKERDSASETTMMMIISW
jgi:hypothetical protein